MKAAEQWLLMEKAALGASVKATTGGDNEAIRRGNLYHSHVYKVLRIEWLLNHIPEDSPWELLIEPWFRTFAWKLRSPDAILLNRAAKKAVVVEVKMNYASGRDVKLLTEYLPLVRSAFDLESSFPVMIVGNTRGMKHKPLLSLGDLIPAAMGWRPGMPTPTLLHVKRIS